MSLLCPKYDYALFMTGKTPDAFSGETPVTYGTAAQSKASCGCTIALRTLQYHSLPRWWTGAAARRRGAAAQRTGTVTAIRSSAVVIQAGARATGSYKGPTWMTRRVGGGLCSSGDEGPRRQQWRPRGEAKLDNQRAGASLKWNPRGPLVLPEKGIGERFTHRPWRRSTVLTAEKGENSNSAPTCRGESKLTEG